MSAARVPDQSDFDLERFVDLFDEAMTSTDPRVVETLRRLMMIVALTRPESNQMHSQKHGPLRRAFEDINHLHRRIERLEDDIRGDRLAEQQKNAVWSHQDNKYTQAAAYNMAAQVDIATMKQLAQKINGGLVPPKGLLDK